MDIPPGRMVYEPEKEAHMEKRSKWKLLLVTASVGVCALLAWWSGGDREDVKEEPLAVPQVAASVEKRKGPRVLVCVSGSVVNPGVYEVEKDSRAGAAIELAGGMTEEADKERVNLAKKCKDGTHVRVPQLSATKLKALRKKKKGRMLSGGGAAGAFAGSGAGMANGGGNSMGAAAGSFAGGYPAGAAVSASSGGGCAPGGGYDASNGGNPSAVGPGGGGASPVSLNRAGVEELTTLPGIGAATAEKIVARRRNGGFLRLEDLMEVPGIGEKKFRRLQGRICL